MVLYAATQACNTYSPYFLPRGYPLKRETQPYPNLVNSANPGQNPSSLRGDLRLKDRLLPISSLDQKLVHSENETSKDIDGTSRNPASLLRYPIDSRSARKSGANKDIRTLYADKTTKTPQASSTRYLLRVVTVLVVVTTVTSFTIVPNSSCSVSTC